MELISKQIAIETILGQPPELHYPSWYAAQIEKLPPAPPEYLAEQAGILATDADTISRAKAIEAICMETCGVSLKNERCMVHCTEVQAVEKLPPAQPGRIRGRWEVASTGYSGFMRCSECKAGCCGDYRSMNFCPNCGADMREVTT